MIKNNIIPFQRKSAFYRKLFYQACHGNGILSIKSCPNQVRDYQEYHFPSTSSFYCSRSQLDSLPLAEECMQTIYGLLFFKKLWILESSFFDTFTFYCEDTWETFRCIIMASISTTQTFFFVFFFVGIVSYRLSFTTFLIFLILADCGFQHVQDFFLHKLFALPE